MWFNRNNPFTLISVTLELLITVDPWKCLHFDKITLIFRQKKTKHALTFTMALFGDIVKHRNCWWQGKWQNETEPKNERQWNSLRSNAHTHKQLWTEYKVYRNKCYCQMRMMSFAVLFQWHVVYWGDGPLFMCIWLYRSHFASVGMFIVHSWNCN